jgi:hypothetical protein
VVLAKLTYYPGIWLDSPRKTMKNLTQDSWCPSWDSKQAPPDYKSKAFLLEQTSSVIHKIMLYIFSQRTTEQMYSPAYEDVFHIVNYSGKKIRHSI